MPYGVGSGWDAHEHHQIKLRLVAAAHAKRAATVAAENAAVGAGENKLTRERVAREDVWVALGVALGLSEASADAARRKKTSPPHDENYAPRLLGFFKKEGVLALSDAEALLSTLDWPENKVADLVGSLFPETRAAPPQAPAASFISRPTAAARRAPLGYEGSPPGSAPRLARQLSRRDLIIGGLGVFGVAAAHLAGVGRVGAGDQTGNRVDGLVAFSESPESDEVDLGQAILSLFPRRSASRKLGVAAGNEHPGWPSTLSRHPSNLIPAATSSEALPVAWTDVGRVDEAIQDVLSFGSTISNEVSRAVFTDENWLRLPYTYLNRDEVQRETVWRWVGGRWYSTTLRAAYLGEELGIVSPSANDTSLQYPFPHGERPLVLADDVLIITAVPNYEDQQAFLADGRVVFVGGVQGTATEAFPAVLRTKSVYEEMMNRINDAKFFQVAVRIGKVRHDAPGVGTKSWGDPESFEVLGVQRLIPGELYRRVVDRNGWQQVR